MLRDALVNKLNNIIRSILTDLNTWTSTGNRKSDLHIYLEKGSKWDYLREDRSDLPSGKQGGLLGQRIPSSGIREVLLNNKRDTFNKEGSTGQCLVKHKYKYPR